MNKISNLEDHIGYWLRYVSNQVSLSFQQRLEEVGITVGEWVVLRLLYDTDLSPAVLAEKIGVTRGAMTKIVDRLFAKEFLERKESTEDRRFQTITITRSGKNLVPQLAQIADENDSLHFSSLSKKEQKVLMDILKKMVVTQNLKNKPIS